MLNGRIHATDIIAHNSFTALTAIGLASATLFSADDYLVLVSVRCNVAAWPRPQRRLTVRRHSSADELNFS